MEFPFSVSPILPNKITIFNGGKKLTGAETEIEQRLQKVIDKFGAASAKAQGLKSAITTYSKLLQNEDQQLYILKESNSVIGFIKTGRKRLFLWDHTGLLHEVVPLCILDFYVHESQQRKGHGKYLFEQVLQNDNLQPFEVAIDRPSVKFLKFLQKHYNLHSYVKQNNNYVVFKNFFTTCVHYDHAYSTNRRHSLPSRVGVDMPVKTEFKNRLSLSPKAKWSIGPIPEDKMLTLSPNSSFHSTLSMPSKTSLTSHENQSTSHAPDNPLEQLPCWSELDKPVKPVPGNCHAPHLTLRGQPRQRQFKSIFEEGVVGGRSFKEAYSVPYTNRNPLESKYSKYEIGNYVSAENPVHRQTPYPQWNSWNKARTWKDRHF